ncbi:MAG TPA: hypothetical protein VJT71_09150 [Pyrinomonadaceae bacterium]|nr:hypothetical protein [Pyrinomonadaceae bacterium]
MKKLSSALLFLCLSFVAVLAQDHSTTPTAGEATNWISVAPEKAGFTLRMPGKPTSKVDPVPGHNVENHMLMLETPAAGYVFSYVQFPDDITDPAAIKGMLDAGRDSGVSSTGGKLKSEKEIRLNEHYGREWIVDMPGGLAAINRAYWVKRRLYQLIFVTSPSTNDTPETLRQRQELADMFFGSFTVAGNVAN